MEEKQDMLLTCCHSSLLRNLRLDWKTAGKSHNFLFVCVRGGDAIQWWHTHTHLLDTQKCVRLNQFPEINRLMCCSNPSFSCKDLLSSSILCVSRWWKQYKVLVYNMSWAKNMYTANVCFCINSCFLHYYSSVMSMRWRRLSVSFNDLLFCPILISNLRFKVARKRISFDCECWERNAKKK